MSKSDWNRILNQAIALSEAVSPEFYAVIWAHADELDMSSPWSASGCEDFGAWLEDVAWLEARIAETIAPLLAA